MGKTLITKCAAATLVAAMLTGFSAYGTLQLTTTGPDATGIQNAWELPAGNVTDQDIVDALNGISGLGLTLATLPPSLVKNNQSNPPSANTGVLANSYNITFITASSPESAKIEYKSGMPFVDTTKLTWLLAKDGVSSYVWNLTGIWNGTETIEINNLWPDQGSFSHIEIGGVAVPEPTTVVAGALLLLPFAASTVRFMRNRKA